MNSDHSLVGQLLGQLLLGQILDRVTGGDALGLVEPRVLGHRDLRSVDQLLHLEQLRRLLRAAHLDDQMAVLVPVGCRDGAHLLLDRLGNHERIVREFALTMRRGHEQHSHRTMLALAVQPLRQRSVVERG